MEILHLKIHRVGSDSGGHFWMRIPLGGERFPKRRTPRYKTFCQNPLVPNELKILSTSLQMTLINNLGQEIWQNNVK